MKKLNNFLSRLDVQGIAVALAMLIMGILFIAFPEDSLRIVCYVSGAVIILWGIVQFCLCFGHRPVRSYEVILSCVIVASGILLIVAPNFIAELITVLLGIILIVDSVLKIIESGELYKLNDKGWIFGAVIGGVCAVLGLVIIFNPFATTRVLMVFVGISMILDAVCSLAVMIYAAVHAGKEEAKGRGDGKDDGKGDGKGGGNVIDI